MGKDMRKATIQEFHDSPAIQVMIDALQAGSAGLNLQIANRAILV